MRAILIALPLAAALAACGGGAGNNSSGEAPAAAQVAAVAAPAGKAWTDVVEFTPEGGVRMGNPNAPIKLIEYGSRTCPACRAFSEASAEPLKAQYVATGRVSFEYRDFLRNGADLAASLLGRCGGPERFFPMLDQMFAAQNDIMGRLQAMPESFYQQLGNTPVAQQASAMGEAAGLIDFVKQRGIPEAQARQCLGDARTTDALVKGTEGAMRDRNIGGTPTFILNGRVLENTTGWTEVQAALRAAGA